MSQLILTAVNSRIQTSLGRLRTYLERVERDLASGDRNQALANLAELARDRTPAMEQFGRHYEAIRLRIRGASKGGGAFCR
jgi:hypothetical protein